MIDFSDFSSEVFQILRAYGKDIVLYDETGKRVFEPAEARRMYVIGDNILVSIVEDGDNSAVKMFLSPSLNLSQVQGFLETLRRLAVQSNLLFHVKKYNKEIKPKDFATQASVNEQKEIQMNIMEGLYGTSKSSYLKLESARMIVRHSTRIKEHVIGDRGRHIHSIFVENAQGERFLFPVNMLSGARAMTQHVNKGGNFADEVGSQIVRMAQDFRNLAQVTNHINNLPGLQEAQKNNEKVEAYGVKGMKSTKWRKVFKNLDALNDWCEKNDAEVHAYSPVEQDKTHESAVALRTAIMESMRGTKRSFSRIYTESTYLGESERVASNQNLLEGSESLSESVSALAAILGEGVSDEALLSVARNVTIEAATAPQLDEEVDGDVEEFDEDEELEGDDEMEEGHQIDVTVEGAFTDTPNNPQIREFESWLESFDPDTMFGGKKQDEAHDPVQAELDQIESQYADPSDMPPDVAARWEELANTNVTNIKWGHDRIQQKTNETPGQWAVKGIIGLDSKFCKKFDSEEARQEWLDKHEGSGKFEVTELVDPSPVVAEDSDEDTWDSIGDFEPGTIGAVNTLLRNRLGNEFHSASVKNDGRNTWLFIDLTVDPHGVAEVEMFDEWLQDAGVSASFDRYTGSGVAMELTSRITEGKSYKRNKDEDADDKKAKDQERKGAAKQKKEPIEEAGNFRAGSKAGFKAGQSAIKNMKAAAKEKEEKEKAEKEKKKPVEEGKSFKRNDDEEGDVKAKRKEDKEKRDAKKPVDEGKSFKRNDDDEVDADVKKKEDKQKRNAKESKKKVNESMDSMFAATQEEMDGLRSIGAEFQVTGNDERGRFVLSLTYDQVDAIVTKVAEEHADGDYQDIGMFGYDTYCQSVYENAWMDYNEQQDIEVDEDSTRFSHSFETNINAEDGSVVSAKVTYVPNEMGAATILSVVRGDTGEDVLPFMDDDDIIHVEGLCADDIAQQGSERFATEATTIPRNPHDDFKNDVMTGGKHGEEQDPGYIARMKALAGLK